MTNLKSIFNTPIAVCNDYETVTKSSSGDMVQQGRQLGGIVEHIYTTKFDYWKINEKVVDFPKPLEMKSQVQESLEVNINKHGYFLAMPHALCSVFTAILNFTHLFIK